MTWEEGVRLVKTGAVSDFTNRTPGHEPLAKDILDRLRGAACRAAYGCSRPGYDPEPPYADCWLFVYRDGKCEILTLGDAMVGTCRYPDGNLLYVVPMRMVLGG